MMMSGSGDEPKGFNNTCTGYAGKEAYLVYSTPLYLTLLLA